MAKRILVHFQSKTGGNIQPGRFQDCILKTLQGRGEKEENHLLVHCELDKNQVIVRPADDGDVNAALLRHPPYCPIKSMSEKEVSEVPSDIINRGINVGVVALVESSDKHVLVTRRAPHMRTFPGVWVPPGGGVDEGETLAQAALRELEEETGLHVESDIQSNHILCLWESVYPPFLDWGLPKRHHLVIYYHMLLNKPHTLLNQLMKLQEEEVDASAWLSPSHVDIVANGLPEDSQVPTSVEKTFPMKIIEGGVTRDTDCPTELLVAKVSGTSAETARISSGTRFALSQWLEKCSSKNKATHCKL